VRAGTSGSGVQLSGCAAGVIHPKRANARQNSFTCNGGVATALALAQAAAPSLEGSRHDTTPAAHFRAVLACDIGDAFAQRMEVGGGAVVHRLSKTWGSMRAARIKAVLLCSGGD